MDLSQANILDIVGLEELFASPVPGPSKSISKQISAATPKVIGRKSVGLVGVRELLKDVTVNNVETNYVGVKEMFKVRKSTKLASPTGVRNLVRSPRAAKSKTAVEASVTPTGLKRMLATPKSKKAVATTSPSGLDLLFQTPKVILKFTKYFSFHSFCIALHS